jgi:hypothetical protein
MIMPTVEPARVKALMVISILASCSDPQYTKARQGRMMLEAKRL